MKKLLTIAIFGMVLSTQAAQINWGLAGQVKYDGTLVGNGGATFTLVYLADATTWETAALDIAKGTSATGATTVSTKTTNAGSMSMQNASPWIFSWADDGVTDIPNTKVANPSAFAFLVTTEHEGQTFYWASETYTVSDSDSNWNGTSQTYTMNLTTANAMGANGENWTAVPEPSTAALALAGLALLLKRRRV